MWLLNFQVGIFCAIILTPHPLGEANSIKYTSSYWSCCYWIWGSLQLMLCSFQRKKVRVTASSVWQRFLCKQLASSLPYKNTYCCPPHETVLRSVFTAMAPMYLVIMVHVVHSLYLVNLVHPGYIWCIWCIQCIFGVFGAFSVSVDCDQFFSRVSLGWTWTWWVDHQPLVTSSFNQDDGHDDDHPHGHDDEDHHYNNNHHYNDHDLIWLIIRYIFGSIWGDDHHANDDGCNNLYHYNNYNHYNQEQLGKLSSAVWVGQTTPSLQSFRHHHHFNSSSSSSSSPPLLLSSSWTSLSSSSSSLLSSWSLQSFRHHSFSLSPPSLQFDIIII